jgi:hypothetical protein
MIVLDSVIQSKSLFGIFLSTVMGNPFVVVHGLSKMGSAGF